MTTDPKHALGHDGQHLVDTIFGKSGAADRLSQLIEGADDFGTVEVCRSDLKAILSPSTGGEVVVPREPTRRAVFDWIRK